GRARQIGAAGRGAQAGGAGLGARRPGASGESRFDPLSRFARVAPDDEARGATEPPSQFNRQRMTDPLDRRPVERVLAGHASDAIRAKEFSHIIFSPSPLSV